MQRLPRLNKLALVLSSFFAAPLLYAASDTAGDISSGNSLSGQNAQGGQTIEVTAAHLRSERIELSPRIGTTVYTVDKHMIESMGQGEDTPFDQVLLRLPGVTEDAKASGSLHVRDDHANVQYRIDGVQLPEGITGFGQSIDTRLIDQVDFMTGALPAQFGLRTAGIVDIRTKEGQTPGGTIGILAGSRGYSQPSAEFYGSQDAFNYYLSGSYLSDPTGIENPLPTSHAVHDRSRQSKAFGNLAYYLDSDTRLSLMFGTYNGRFQIPVNPGLAPAFSLTGISDAHTGTSLLPSSDVNENQHESNRFAVLSLQKSLGDLNFQVSGFHQYSELHYYPDPVGDLVYNGVASDALRSARTTGLQFDAGYKLGSAHTLRTGVAYTRQNSQSDNTVAVFPLDGNGIQASTEPVTIADDNRKLGKLSSFYVQDEWHVSQPLTLNYGMRFDKVSAFIDERQWSPRVNLSYKVGKDTAFHAGYSRYFTPPPQELISQSSIDLYANTSNAPKTPGSDPVKAERSHYYDIGVSHQLTSRLTLTADAYYKKVSNLLDEGQFGRALILTPFNYEKGDGKGLELSSLYEDKKWGGYLNASVQKAEGSHIVSSQSLFEPAELDYIAGHYIHLDHDQRFTLSGGVHCHFGDSLASADFLHGSGLRMTPSTGAPNSSTLPGYTTFNASLTHTWKETAAGDIEARVAIVNLFDKSYELRDGSGVGVGAPQFGLRRTLYAGLSTHF